MDRSEALNDDLKKYCLAIETLEYTEQDLKQVEESIQAVRVDSYLLELDLAIQSHPNVMIRLQEMEEICSECEKAVTDDVLCFEDTELNCNDHIENLVGDALQPSGNPSDLNGGFGCKMVVPNVLCDDSALSMELLQLNDD